MGAVCGVVGGLIDSADNTPTADSASIAVNSVVPEDFMRILSLLLGHHTTFSWLACKTYILATTWKNPYEIMSKYRNRFEFRRGGCKQRR
jgi:hypothetical protein